MNYCLRDFHMFFDSSVLCACLVWQKDDRRLAYLCFKGISVSPNVIVLCRLPHHLCQVNQCCPAGTDQRTITFGAEVVWSAGCPSCLWLLIMLAMLGKQLQLTLIAFLWRSCAILKFEKSAWWSATRTDRDVCWTFLLNGGLNYVKLLFLCHSFFFDITCTWDCKNCSFLGTTPSKHLAIGWCSLRKSFSLPNRLEMRLVVGSQLFPA